MLLVIQKDKAKKILDKYFNTLATVGYVKHPVVSRYLVWLFLVDFVERVYTLLTDEDYNAINNLLMCLFDGGNCLLPYLTTRSKITIGENLYMGSFDLRGTEDGMLRNANDNLRQTE